MTSDTINQKTMDAYKWYSKYYAIIALLTYWIVWRGNLRRHIRFFRESLHYSKSVLDVATGDGTLTHVALFSKASLRAECVLAVDISEHMLEKAKKKLKERTEFLRADVENLPFESGSRDLITCFGGFNSFASGRRAFAELSRVLNENGVIRGSFLLMPKAAWKQKLVRRWIEQGYQSCELSLSLFEGWSRSSGLFLSHVEQHGDVVLFELAKIK